MTARNKPDPFTVAHGITRRQWDVLAAIASNGNQNVAALELGISYQTFKNHVQDALKNLDVPNVMSAFRKLGWLHVPEHPGDTGGWPEMRQAIREELLPTLLDVASDDWCTATCPLNAEPHRHLTVKGTRT